MASFVRSAVVAIACVLLIAGCNPPVPTPTGGASPTPTPAQSANVPETTAPVSAPPTATPTVPPAPTPTSPPEPTPQSTLAAPVLISPPDGSVFGNYPRITTCKWGAVAGAVKYQFEAEFWEINQKQWVMRYSAKVSATTYTFDFVGKQPGRWRVAAVDAGGHAGMPSGWWGFVYTV